MELSEEGIALIKQFEGLRHEAYQCPAGIWTIGYGHTADVRPGDVNRQVTTVLTQNQFDALVSFVFNLGSNNFRASTLLKKLNTGDYIGAAAELMRWVYAGGKPSPGLIRRREAEKLLFTGYHLDK